MKKINFKKVICGVSLGTVMAFGSMSSAFAADLNHTMNPAKKVESQQQQHVLTKNQVKAIALKQYKGNVKDTRLTKENGKDVYVSVIHGQDGKDRTVRVDPSTGSLIKLTQQQVKDIALKQYKGTVKNVQLNHENGQDVYKISIQDQNGKNHDVKIDANTGDNFQ
jgi:uncharacterized membrane protein YkoI